MLHEKYYMAHDYIGWTPRSNVYKNDVPGFLRIYGIFIERGKSMNSQGQQIDCITISQVCK